jgi:hypothetical protein
VAGDAREEFARQFDELLRVSGLQAKQVVALAMRNRSQQALWEVTDGLISAWRTGRNLPSKSNQVAFLTVVRVLNQRARARAPIGQWVNNLLDAEAWIMLLEGARVTPPAPRQLPGADCTIGSRSFKLSREASGVVRQGNRLFRKPVGSSVSRLSDPFQLGVHRSIEIGGAPQGATGLPFYVKRAHDDLLQNVIASAMRASAMVVLVGDSSTGKTRAWWEALQHVPAGWQLYSPGDLLALSTALSEGSVGPRTVLWLDDLHNYLDPTAGDLVADTAGALRGNTMSLRVFDWGRPRDLAFYAVLEASAVTGNVCLVGQVLLQAERHACRLCP